MRNLTTRSFRISVLAALMALATVGSASGPQMVAAAEVPEAPIASSSVTAPLPAATCSYAFPCVVSITTGEQVLDYGGPGLLIDRFEE